MIIIIPIGGIGTRFKNNGYKNPKALINIFGKSIISYLLDNLVLTNEIDFIYIPYNKEYLHYNFESTLKKKYPDINLKFYVLEKNTKGAAETLNLSIKYLNIITSNKYLETPILSLDCDNFYTCNIIKLWNGENKVFCIKDESTNPVYSYLKIENNKIIDIVEKQKISNLACTGAYGFSSVSLLLKYSNELLNENKDNNHELFTSLIIQKAINSGIHFKPETLNIDNWICLGTPFQLKLFYNNYPKISSLSNSSMISNKRICFDLDNTLVTYPEIKDDYTSVKPIQKNINFLKYLKRFDNTIIIYTARRMKTHGGNIGKLNKDIGKITFDTLEKFDIPFDEIYFGKPYAHFYIDDLAINTFDDLEKSIGYYQNIIEPRNFNSIEVSNINTITKTSHNLDGEIYYYNNIPNELKDLFPIFLNNTNKSYTIEKINGITATDMYLSEIMTIENLKHIMNSIKRIQSTKLNYQNDSINIYDNYSRKIKSRYNNFNYSKFVNSEKVYQSLINKLGDYEQTQSGKKVIIHGDTVMTNILINNHGKIKLIDMRGKQGDILSIEGDWLYDWAKLYQSLIGYDKILMGKIINETYEKKMIDYFETYFIKLYSEKDLCNLKIITNSLLFSLIPLHNNDKCYQYYNLIKI